VINFAYGEMGAFGAAILAKVVLDYQWNFFLALLAVLTLGGLLGAAVELLVVRRLFKAPRLILLVATIGVAQLVFALQLVLPDIDHAARYPSPIPGTVTLGNLVLHSEHFMVLAFVPLVIMALGLLLTRRPCCSPTWRRPGSSISSCSPLSSSLCWCAGGASPWTRPERGA